MEPSCLDGVGRSMKRLILATAAILIPGCGSNSPPAAHPVRDSGAPLVEQKCTPPTDGVAPTYAELYAKYFAPGTPGHCATSHCHGNPGFDVWLCGDSKDSCYAGMVSVGLVNPADPVHSLIGDEQSSPLSWINPAGGNMPFDHTGAFPEGRNAILAWVAACAVND